MLPPAAIIVLNQNSVALGRQIASALPSATVYGLLKRTTRVDRGFDNFGDTLRELFASGTPIVGVCAAGILIRSLAPIISDKRQEPPVLAVAEDGSAVVPLLGGLQGVNDMARLIAAVLEVPPAITTTGDIRFRTALLAPPKGYYLANPEAAKGFISDLLAGAKVKLKGNALLNLNWLVNSKLPFDANGDLEIRVTEYKTDYTPDCLVYHPATLAIGASVNRVNDIEHAVVLVKELLVNAGLSEKSVAGVFALNKDAAQPAINQIASVLDVPLRLLELESIQGVQRKDIESQAKMAELLALTATGSSGKLLTQVSNDSIEISIALSSSIIDADTIGKSRGKLFIVGTGPGASGWMSPEVKRILNEATDLVGYSFYLDLAGALRPEQRRHDSDNREELARAKMALDLAAEGRNVAVVSSGDPGIYAMAAAIFEVLESNAVPEWQHVQVQVAPGISALQAAAAKIGAPIGHDFCVISLSDILKPWSIIESRIIAAASSDMVIAFYNPASKQRTWQLTSARDILLKYRLPETPVVLARNLGRVGESVLVRSLGDFSVSEVDMRTLVLVGSSKTRVVKHSEGVWVYTPRQYSEG
ncbi:precorrin-3 methylase CobJ [Dulcicalothrix desertica PCC 7102]|uniref:Precorrin-3 methylase CobJ n=1 Tax=Dulcicalothrix desertica PCC 7102 TaxID=232991 RepID=A0A3S1DG15_9CYAN|nr:precorrin-3B C(17)-methyltransferase [Dulcicalothrix desertica]RUT09184.1 precorrin-3 methylase CobJ [Dulcicalothrix desertica PCC 7102]TWH55064.1 precorrin-3 methyltransferase [Dulcicalothrix desertica PCC 7102]